MGDFLSRKKWVVSKCDRDRAANIAESCGIEPFSAYLLCARGMTDEFEVESFLYDTDLIDPFTLPDMEEACARIEEALENGEHITVFGDYDADGVTSTAILYSYLVSCGANADYYIPDRAEEGYGMNIRAIKSLKERGTSLIITVDNGISALEEIEYAGTLGIDVVVTDHHKAGDVLPRAIAVVDPHRNDTYCDFREWAGVGVAFKLICALSKCDGYELLEAYGDLVALGTVADIVPLVSENRIIVRSGLAYINGAIAEGNLRPGIRALLEETGNDGSIDASALAFRLSPRINAAGRMGSAERALKLLLAESIDEAKEIAAEIASANAGRQSIEADITAEAVEIIENNADIKYSRVIVVSGKDWHQGVIGIVSSRLVEKYGKPCIVISESGDVAKGSGRSIDGFSLYDALTYCAPALVQYGGHVLAAGMSVEKDKIDDFRRMINEYAAKGERPVPVLNIDCKLNPANINCEILSELKVLEPFGAENPQPLFGLYNMEITALQPVSNGKHLRVSVRRNGYNVTGILFSVSVETFPYAVGDVVDLAVKLSENEYMGKVKVNIQIKDIKLSGADDDKVLAAHNHYEDFYLGNGELFKEKLNISRDFCGNIYRFLKSNNGWHFSAEMLCHRMNLGEDNILSSKIALDVLVDLGLLCYNDGNYTMPLENKKVSLEDSEIFRRAVALS